MPTFEKDVLYPGQWKPPGFKAPVHFTREHAPSGVTAQGAVSVPFLAQRLQDMLAAKLQIPVTWEHQAKLKPMTAAEADAQRADLAKLTVGHATRADLDPAGFVKTEIDVPVAADAERLPAVRFISPQIEWDVEDGTGKKWPGPSITHLAATPRPVQHTQQPFKQLSMSIIRLSMDDYDGEDVGKKGDDGTKDGAGGENRLKSVIDCLGRCGIVLPEDTNPENFVERLHTACLTYEAAANPSNPNNPPGEREMDMPAGVALSLSKRLVAMEEKDLARRLKELFTTGRISAALRDKLAAELKTIKLSLDGEGKFNPNPTVAKVEAYEALDPDTAWPASVSLSRHGQGEREIPLPEGAQAKNGREGADEFFRLTGSRY